MAGIACRIIRRQVNAILCVPRGNGALVRAHPVAAAEGLLQECRLLIHAFLLHEESDDGQATAVRIAAKAQHMIDFLLRKGKSEGRGSHALRHADLFRF